MAFPHPKSRQHDCWNGEIPNHWSVVRQFFEWAIDIAGYRNGEDNVNPAKDRTLGGFFHDLLSLNSAIRYLANLDLVMLSVPGAVATGSGVTSEAEQDFLIRSLPLPVLTQMALIPRLFVE